MDDRTLVALKASIQHWQENIAQENSADVSVLDTDCALCAEFAHDDCNGCPIKEHTGKSDCYGSPYYAARANLYNWRNDETESNKAQFRKSAQDMVDFMTALLPK